jgi:vitamin B12 transporter
MNKKVFLVVMAGLLCSKGLLAEEQPKSFTGEEMVVTSSRVEEPKKNVTSNITIIGRDEIAHSSATDLGELLAEKNIGQIQKYPGTLTSVGIRGFRSESHGNDLMGKVLVLVDGRRAGTGNLAKIMTDNVERIEIIRGPAAVQYGSAAIGGVINVITVRGEGFPSLFIEQKVGSSEYSKTAVGTQGRVGNIDFSGSFSISDAGDYSTGSNEKYLNTGYSDQTLASFNVGYEFAPGHRVGINYHSFDVEKAGSPSYLSQNDSASYTVNNNHSVDFIYEGSLSDQRFAWMARYFTGMDEYQYVDPSFSYKSSSNVDQRGGQAQLSFSQKSLRMTAGVDWLQYDLQSTLVPLWSKYENPAYFLLGKYALFDEKLILTAGIRYDDYRVDMAEGEGSSRSADNFSQQAGLAWHVSDMLKLRGSYAEGFRMPSARELAGQINSFGKMYIGNPDLNPETSDTWEAGFDIVSKGLNSSLTWFTTDYTGMIETVATAADSFSYRNIGSARVSGIESELSWKLNSLSPSWVFEPYVSYTHLLEYKDNGTGKPLLYTPKWNASTGLRLRDMHGFSGAFNVACTGRSMIQDYESSWSGTVVTKGSFAVANVSASKRLSLGREGEKGLGITLKAEVDNLFDRQYQYVKGYTMPGRTFILGLKADI